MHVRILGRVRSRGEIRSRREQGLLPPPRARRIRLYIPVLTLLIAALAWALVLL